MDSDVELVEIAERLDFLSSNGKDETKSLPLVALEKEAKRIGRSFSGSWLGYHAYVYYQDLEPPPPGAHFSQEWGLRDESWLGHGSKGDWLEYDPMLIRTWIFEQANVGSIDDIKQSAELTTEKFKDHKSETLSILSNALDQKADRFISELKAQLEQVDAFSTSDVTRHYAPNGQIMTRDTLALGQKLRIPPHIAVLAEIESIRSVFAACKAASKIAKKAAAHLNRKGKAVRKSERIGTNVFIGHGRASSWRELKDFVQDRLRLPWDEFNRIPIAGVTNIARLSEMLDAAAIAFLVMTAEDETADGEVQARMNVIHEAGLFQGRLGFTRAIVLLEDGCKEFSNIQGLGQIRFPRGKISAAFEEVRLIIEREELI